MMEVAIWQNTVDNGIKVYMRDMYPKDEGKAKAKSISRGLESKTLPHLVPFREYTAIKPGVFTICCLTMNSTTFIFWNGLKK